MTEIIAVNATQNASLESMYVWGLTVIRAFQSAGNPAVTVFARLATLLADPGTLIILIPVILWCVDEKRGYRLALLVFVSNAANVALKQNLRVIRPFIRDPSVALAHESTFSTPSGHSQTSAAFYPSFLLGGQSLRAWRFALSLAIPLLVGASRVYLGVHYPTDVLFGWAAGAIFAVSALKGVPALARAIMHTRAYASVRETFDAYANRTGGGARAIRTIKIIGGAALALFFIAFSKGDTRMGGMLFGFIAGGAFLTECGDAYRAAEGSIAKKTLRLAIGFAGLAVIYVGLRIALPGEGSEWYPLCRFARFGLSGFWASCVAPRLFVKLDLAKRSSAPILCRASQT